MSSRFTSVSSLSDECAFCLESINEYDYATLNCNHIYHLRCIQEWVNITKNITKLCPLCDIDGEILTIQSGKKSDNTLIEEQSYNKKSNGVNENNTNQQSQSNRDENNQNNYNNQTNTSAHQPQRSQLEEIEDEVSYFCCAIL